MVNIKVAVRIRPLSERELRRGEEIIVRKENKTVLVTNPKIPERQDGDSRQRMRRFTVDFCYDSSDPEGSSQEAVYKEIGSEVVYSMYEGYNACVLAYGHSASGKTYTIMGLESDPGLTPRLCEGLFDKLHEECPEGRIRVQIIISFLEIYNEKVRDLLGNEDTGATCGNFSLRVREHPKLGPYVQGLSEHLVADKRELLQLLTTGNRRRSTAATESNIHSSRSHAVFTIQLKQSDGENYETEKSSKVHLVDLAGRKIVAKCLEELSLRNLRILRVHAASFEVALSGTSSHSPGALVKCFITAPDPPKPECERARASQSKARLQEGANINKSLATLGNVICALAESYDSGILFKEPSTSKSWQPFVPYRDSVLTWLLKDTLGGNSNTIMIATISPASSCISETVNTLRYAKRAKKIVNQPIVNEDPKTRTIRELRKEIARLKGLLIFFRSCGRIVDPWDRNSEKNPGFSRPESKCPEPEGTQITIKEGGCWKKENSCAKSTNKEDEVNQAESKEDEEREKVSGGSKLSRKKESRAGFWRSGAGFSGGDACEIDDEKKSDVNGSVNDNFSHETQFFSDSLESFSSLLLKSGNSCDTDNEQPGAGDNDLSNAHIQSLNLTRNFCSDENLSKIYLPAMLHRSRPDLIKGISTRTQDNGLPLGSSHSCTDVSNLSHSTSENSLNSSGSTEVQLSENRSPQNPKANDSTSARARAERREKGAGKTGARNEALQATAKKKEKRLEVAESVTSRLYSSKKKPDNKTEAFKKEDNDYDFGDIDELKLCKRARMKLFDISRKLAMSRKMKKTVDSDTQTDSVTGTVRVKEKCVTTDPAAFEAVASEESSRESKKKKPYVIMNQVFIPRASNYVVECGEVVRVEGRQESATQTSRADKGSRTTGTSPGEFSPREDDCFSEDSLDLEGKSPSCRELFSGEVQTNNGKLCPEARVKLNWEPNFEVNVSHDFEKSSVGESGAQSLKGSEKSAESGDVLFNGLLLPVFMDDRMNSGQQVGIFIAHPPSSVFEPRKGENVSSENSFTSTEGTENNSLSETSSEDFVFYENPKDLAGKSKGTSDRELYTISENSEQSDPSDAFSPVQRHRPSFKAEEPREWTESPMRGLQGIKLRSAGIKKEAATFGGALNVNDLRETTPSFKSGKLHSGEVKTEIPAQKCDEVHNRFQQIFDSRKAAPEKPSVPKSPSPPSDRDPKNAHQLPNTRTAFQFSENFAERKESEKADAPSCSGDGCSGRKEMHRTDFQFKPQKQYLNLNISNSSGVPPFSVDTHLFGKAAKGDQSTDAMSTSADSITLVFMGPAKPKTSVLMEIIGRSLGRSCFTSETSLGEKQSRSTGVQCDASLMRSVSVDSAMIALSRIARNQEGLPEMQRTTSLGKLDPDEMLAMLGKGRLQSQLGSSCQCRCETGDFKEEKKKCVLQCSVGTSTVSDSQEINKGAKTKSGEAEKPKKSVSWFGEAVGGRWGGEGEDLDFGLKFKDFPEAETDKSNDVKFWPTSADCDLPERRVRFLKPENLGSEEMVLGQTRDTLESGSGLTAFLKEATQLLRNINSRSSKQIFSEEVVEETGAEWNRRKEENRKCGFKTSKKAEGVTKGGTQGFPEKEGCWKWKTTVAVSGRSDENQINLTWPRRRPTTGKPPTGTKPRFPRSLLPSRFETLHSNGLPNSTSSTSNLRSWSQSSRMGSNGQSWNLSNLSVQLGNSYFGDTESRPSSSRSSYCNETNTHRDFCASPVTSPRRMIYPRPNVDSISDLETDLEECCRRLEMATEQDKARGKIHERRKKAFEYCRNEEGLCSGNEEEEKKGEVKRDVSREVVGRRKAGGCAGSCVCGGVPGGAPCKRLWSRGCRSSFELDSFGPGSKHCPQFCMFCRKKEAEVYYSAVSLNSECSSGLCRLNYYGFCPCSPVKLNQVVLSPRAYMQRLLALRKQIVSDSKYSQLQREEIQYRNCRGLSLREWSELPTTQNFS